MNSLIINIENAIENREFSLAKDLLQHLSTEEQMEWMGWIVFYQEGLGTALEHCKRLLKINSQDPDVIGLWGLYGFLEWNNGEPIKALALLKKRLHLGWDKRTFLNTLSLCSELGQTIEAEQIFVQFQSHLQQTSLTPTEWDLILLCKAQIARFNQQPTEALQLLQSLHHEIPEKFLLRGHILRDECLFTQSMMAYQEGLDKYGMHPALLQSFQSVLPHIPSIPSGVLQLAKSQPESPEAMLKIRAYLERKRGELLERDADSPEVQHLTAALYGKNLPKPPKGYVEELFDDYAERFESHLVEQLKYQVPILIESVLKNRFSSLNPAGAIWDLGCGTGLLGPRISDVCVSLLGVDLSAQMLLRAKHKGCYTHLIQHDIVSFCIDKAIEYESPDAVVIADTLVYLGDLKQFFTVLQPLLNPQCEVLFTVEQMSGSNHVGYQLMPTGRYTHNLDAIRFWLKQSGMTLLKSGPVELRQGGGKWVKGFLCIAGNQS